MRPLVISISVAMSLGLWLLMEGQALSNMPGAQGAEPVSRVDAPTAREALLERRVRTLEDQLATASADDATQAPASQGKPGAGDAGESAGCVDLMAARFDREVTRDAWTETRAAVLRDWVAGSEAREWVEGVECRGRTCRLAVGDLTSAAPSLMLPLLQRMPRQLKALHIAQCADRGAALYVLF